MTIAETRDTDLRVLTDNELTDYELDDVSGGRSRWWEVVADVAAVAYAPVFFGLGTGWGIGHLWPR